jgi:cysteine desulfuration protein SufE
VIPRDDLTKVVIAELMAATNWQQQYRLIIQWGKLVQPKPAIRVPANLVKGCELPVWLQREQDGERYYFSFDSDSSVMNGLAVLLLVQLNGKPPAELRALDLSARLRELGFERHLTPSRNNGLHRIMERARALIETN